MIYVLQLVFLRFFSFLPMGLVQKTFLETQYKHIYPVAYSFSFLNLGALLPLFFVGLRMECIVNHIIKSFGTSLSTSYCLLNKIYSVLNGTVKQHFELSFI